MFVSIHANAMPNSRATRGVRDLLPLRSQNRARRRVAALENAVQELEDGGGRPPDQDSELHPLRAQEPGPPALVGPPGGLVQGEMSRVHPGPNRGVKQGPSR